MRRYLKTFTNAGLALVLTFALAAPGLAQESKRLVYVVPVEGMIDLGLVPFIQRVLNEAANENAAAVILDINTFGGRVDAAVQIRDALLNSKVLTIAFINKRAISAGALISLASEKIAIGSGGTIGAAAPVQIGQGGEAAKPVTEKTVSYVSKEFRSTAEARGRPALIAQAMVDADVTIPNVIQKGKLLTLTTEEAVRLKVADVQANTINDVLTAFGITNAELVFRSVNWAENVVRFLTNPIISSLLISLAMIGILLEIRTPGFGFPGAIGITSLSLFLWGHWIAQLAGWEELLIAGFGVALLAIELVVIPGFGIVGILGLIAIATGLVMSMVGAGNAPQFIMMTIIRVMVSIAIAIVITLGLMKLTPRLSFGRRLVLDTKLSTGTGFESAPPSDHRLLDKIGKVSSPLHPAGIADFDGERVDVVSEGEAIDVGSIIKVVKVDGNRVVVRRHQTDP
jgi:membrane-bound serine protease (ClpP class)